MREGDTILVAAYTAQGEPLRWAGGWTRDDGLVDGASRAVLTALRDWSKTMNEDELNGLVSLAATDGKGTPLGSYDLKASLKISIQRQIGAKA